MVRGGDAVVDRVLQLRGPAGDFLGLPSAGKGISPFAGATRSAGFLVRVGVRAMRAVRREHRRPRTAQIGDSGRPARLERHLHGHGAGAQLRRAAVLPCGRGDRRVVLLPRLHVADRRLSRQGDALARPRHPSDERLYRHDRGWSLRGPDRPGIRMAMELPGLRRAGRGARAVPETVSDRARTARGRHAERIPAPEFLRIVWGTPTVLILMAAFLCANFVAVVLLSWMPKFLYDRFPLSLAAAGLTATVFVQLASMAGSPLGGWLADFLRKRTPGGRMMVQAVGVFGGAPFVVLCALTASVKWLIVALIAWGFFKGLYDANIFASMFDVIRPEARGTAAGLMNMTGWLGGGMAPLVIGYIAQSRGLSFAIATAAAAYVAAGALLLAGVLGSVKRDAARMQAQLEGEAL